MQLLSPIFARILKVDEATRTVTGRATQEMIDRDNEVFDYATSKPEFQRWSAEVFQDSGGKSLGNVRSMHGTTAAGVLKDIHFDDHEKAIDVTAKIVDDNEWKKVQEGVYTGFSIGGRYAKKWPDIMHGKMVNRYTAVPSELSIVDRPCVPAAKFFTVHKADGSTLEVAFKSAVKSADAGQENGVPRQKDPNADDAIATNPNGNFGGKAAEKREFSDKERQDAADAGQALPDGSFPIKSAADLENAIQAYGRAKDKAKAKAHIITRARALGATDKLPDDWKKADGSIYYKITDLAEDHLAKLFNTKSVAINDLLKKSSEIEFSKGVYDVATLSQIVAQLKNLADGADIERKIEGDASPLPEKLRASSAELLILLSEMASEEGNEVKNGTTAEDVLRDTNPAPMFSAGLYRADVSPMAKALRAAFGVEELSEEDLAKRGARNSAKDMAIIQKVHDAVCELGATCAGPHTKDGEAVSPPPTQKTDQGDLGKQETTTMAGVNKGDTVTAEGNKRGAAVTNPSLPVESSNGTDAERTGDAGQEAEKRGARSATKDDDDAMKGKSRVSKDDDDDDDDDDKTKARKAKARKAADEAYKRAMATKDDDDDDDDDKGKSSKARKFEMTEEGLANVIAKAVTSALSQSGGAGVTIPRVAPNLMSVGKGGDVAKVETHDVDALKKSVNPHPKDATGLLKDQGDNETTTLIKAIHKNRIVLDDTDMRALGNINALVG